MTPADTSWDEYYKVKTFLSKEFGVDMETAWRLYKYFKEDYDGVIKS